MAPAIRMAELLAQLRGLEFGQLVRVGAKAYAIFGVVHVCAKLLRCASLQLRTLSVRRNTAIPCEFGSALTGKIGEMVANIDRVHDWRRDFFLKHNSKNVFTRGLVLQSPAIELLTIDPAVVRHILKNEHDTWNKPDITIDWFFFLFNKWLGDGIFSLQHGTHIHGLLHRFQRKVAAGIFTKNNFNLLMQRTFVEKGQKLIDVLAAVPPGHSVDMQQKFFAFTMDSIMGIFFGRKTNTLSDVADPFAQAYDDAHRSLFRYFLFTVPILAVVGKLPYPFGGIFETGGIVEPLLRRLHPEGRIFNRSVAKLTREAHTLIDARRTDPQLEKCSDLLALFMNANAENGEKLSDPKYTTMLRDVCLNFIIAGRDTTACTLTWMFYILATHPQLQARLCEEIDEHLPRGTEPTLLNTAPTKMPYLTGVIYEALRLYPPVPADPKMSSHDDTLPDGTVVPAGAVILYFPWAMGRDAERYPDPLEVRPERWIPFSEPDPFEFPVFQAGPRICLGLKMAVFEAKILASMLLQHYTFSLKPGEAEKITYSLMATMSVCNDTSPANPADKSFALLLNPVARK